MRYSCYSDSSIGIFQSYAPYANPQCRFHYHNYATSLPQTAMPRTDNFGAWLLVVVHTTPKTPCKKGFPQCDFRFCILLLDF
jgi:hypothetical protein